ncbi:galactose mutarotase [Paracoccus sp. DMF-8]|uniref:aldose epimerase family protein n=1 Tax=Paracoccus sp. DMF-8 TaxID=3019445 RepID=UPI0023E7EF1B|nr:galactose mutarotase [Paracoccus sp. DMF-8]MDF3604966.1 galactose mutarotase [Paracoccus sp. DMF-8]
MIRLAAHGLTARIMSLGASLCDLRLADGDLPLVLGFADLDPYLDEGRDFGAIIGRCAGPIAGARARIGALMRELDANDRGRHCRDGGRDGLSRRNWRIAGWKADTITLTDRLPAGHMGFPGNMDLRVSYTINRGPALHIVMVARTDAQTLCNLAAHHLLSLGCADSADLRVTVHADHVLPAGPDGIPTGDIRPVAGTGLDLRQPRNPGHLAAQDFCLRPGRSRLARPAARVEGNGIALDLLTTEAGLRLDPRPAITPGAAGLGGRAYGPHSGILLRAQGWPDAIHQPGFAQSTLLPGTTYRQETILRFGRG